MPVFEDCLDRIKVDIDALSLVGSPVVIVSDTDWNQHQFHPGIIVHPAYDDIKYGPGTNAKDDHGYGCQVTMIESESIDEDTLLTRRTTWRDSISRKFINQRLSTVTSVHTMDIEPNPPIPPTLRKEGFRVHAIVVRCWSRETRG